MRKHSRAWAVLLLVALLLTVAGPLTTAAEAPLSVPVPRFRQSSGLQIPEVVGLSEAGEEPAALLAATPNYYGARKALLEGILACKDAVDLSEYAIPEDEFGPVVYQYVIYRYGQLFHLDSTALVGFSVVGGLVQSCPLPYRMDAQEYAQAKEELETLVQNILDQIPAGFSDGEKVIFVHDYLVSHQAYYSPDLFGDPDESKAIKDVYRFLSGGKGDCQAYSLTFELLMDRLGIPVSFVESPNLHHMWNVVRVDGHWYHIDVTHDDPVMMALNMEYTEIIGSSQHTFCLISTDTCQALRQADWEESWEAEKEANPGIEVPPFVNDWGYGQDVDCSDTTFEDRGLGNAVSSCAYLPETDSWYCLYTVSGDTDPIYKVDGDAAPLLELRQYDRGAGRSFTLKQFSHESYPSNPMIADNGALYFSMPFTVYRYGLADGKLDTLFQASLGNQLMGIFVDDQQRLFYRLYDTAAKELRLEEYKEFDPYPNNNGVVRYYFSLGTLNLASPQDDGVHTVLAAWYDQSTRQLLDVTQCGGIQRLQVPSATDCAIFTLTSDQWAPGAAAIWLNGSSAKIPD